MSSYAADVIHCSYNDPDKSFQSIILPKIEKPITSDCDFDMFSNFDLFMSEMELRDIHVSTHKMECPLKKSRYPTLLPTRSLVKDELEMLKINMSMQDQDIVFRDLRNLKTSTDKEVKVMKGTRVFVKKSRFRKKKDLLAVIEGSETAKTDKVIWKFLKRDSILRKEYLSIKKFLIELQGIRSPDSRLQNTQPVKLTCPNCRFYITTRTENVSTARTKIISLILNILGMCSASFMMITIKDTVHLCPLCHIYLGFCPALGLRYRSREIRTFPRDVTPEKSRPKETAKEKIKYPEKIDLEELLDVYTENRELKKLLGIYTDNYEMVSASSTSAKNLFAEPKLRLCDRVQVNVNNVAAIARQIQRGSKASENLITAARNFAVQEAAIENAETNLKKLKLITTHMHNQLDSLHNSSSKVEVVLEQVRSMQR